jgi:hypothetical protein
MTQRIVTGTVPSFRAFARVSGTRSARSSWGKATRKVTTVLTCDYNGWNDAPEEEREWFDEHPEDLSGSIRDSEIRPLRATPRIHVRRFRGGLAA